MYVYIVKRNRHEVEERDGDDGVSDYMQERSEDITHKCTIHAH